MLLAEHVLAQRRGDKLALRVIDAKMRERAELIARDLIDGAKRSVGASRGELDAALSAVDSLAKDVKLKAGLTKLVLDRCTFENEPEIAPEDLRMEVFARAAVERRANGHVARDALIADVARAHEMDAAQLEHALYADLKASHRVVAFDAIAPPALVEALVRGQAQAVLLRAEHVDARVRCSSPGTLRALFRALKFHRLLFTASPPDESKRANDENGTTHVIRIDGPMSLFDSGTKYGPRLAMALPALEACDALELDATVRWGKERLRLGFHHEHRLIARKRDDQREDELPLPDEVEALRDALARGDHGLRVRRSSAILTLPGTGTCVPDLELRDSRGRIAYVEVLGFWSRDAVWRRVELAEKGLGARVVFCVSSRLRVSEEVLPVELPATLYVYKGAMSARAIAERAKTLLERDLTR